MSCDTCTKTLPIPTCTDNLIIGNVASLLTDVYIYLSNLTTGGIKRYDATTSAGGLVTLDMTDDPYGFTPNQAYELWITLKTATDVNTKLPITINSVAYDCISPVFERIEAAGGTAVDYLTLNVKMDI